MTRFRERAPQRADNIRCTTSNEQVVVVGEDGASNLDDLEWRLAFAVDDLGKTFSEGTMAVHTGEFEMVCAEGFELPDGVGGF